MKRVRQRLTRRRRTDREGCARTASRRSQVTSRLVGVFIAKARETERCLRVKTALLSLSDENSWDVPNEAPGGLVAGLG